MLTLTLRGAVLTLTLRGGSADPDTAGEECTPGELMSCIVVLDGHLTSLSMPRVMCS